jgi:hypothetical protein
MEAQRESLMTWDLAVFSWIRDQKLDELYFIKIKNFCAPKDTINRVKRQLAYIMEENFVNHIFYEGLVSRIYKELKLNNKNPNNSTLKCAKDLN